MVFAGIQTPSKWEGFPIKFGKVFPNLGKDFPVCCTKKHSLHLYATMWPYTITRIYVPLHRMWSRRSFHGRDSRLHFGDVQLERDHHLETLLSSG